MKNTTSLSKFRKNVFASVCVFIAVSSASAEGLFDPEVLNKDYGYNYNEINNVDPKVATLTTGLLGDTIDPASGSIKFTQTDVSIPGNFNIPVQITRTLSDPSSWHTNTQEFGNWSLDIPHVRSTYASKNGDYKTAYWPNGEACSRPLNSNPNFSIGQGVAPVVLFHLDSRDYWNGDTISIPGKGSVKMLMDTDSSKRTNNRDWDIECLDDLPEKSHEGFKVTTTDGVKYYFGEQRVITDSQELSYSAPSESNVCFKESDTCANDMLAPDNSDGRLKAQKHYIFLLVTKIEDKFGNYVDYNYNDAGQLESITSSDNREIGLTYYPTDHSGNGAGNVHTVTANGRTWTYEYENERFNVGPLTRVTLPNEQTWEFNNSGTLANDGGFWRELFPPQARYGDTCYDTLGLMKSHYITITHPYGATGEFELMAVCQGQTNVPRIERANPGDLEERLSHWIKPSNRTISIERKTLTLPDGTDYVWEYEYSGKQGLFEDEEAGDEHTVPFYDETYAAENLKSTKVTQPDGSYYIEYFDRVYGRTNGNRLFREDYEKPVTENVDGKLLKRTAFTYSYSPSYGENKSEMNISWSPEAFHSQKKSYSDEFMVRTDKQTIELFNGAASLGTYEQEVVEFNEYHKPVKIVEDSANGKRYVHFSYLHDLVNDVLNLPSSVRVSDADFTEDQLALTYTSNQVSRTDYKQISDSANPKAFTEVSVADKEWAFGTKRKEFSEYHLTGTAKGQIKKVEFNAALTSEGASGNRYVKYLNYYRGMPRTITVPARYSSGEQSAYRTVDDNGWVESITDFNSTLTEYGYDDAGRLRFIKEPEDEVDWLDSLFTWGTVAGTGPQRVLQRCVLDEEEGACIGAASYTESVNFDSLLRPVLTEKAAPGLLPRFQRREFDAFNQETFVSHWSASVLEANGTTNTYDGLRRLRTSAQSGLGSQSIDYLAGNKQRLTNNRGFATTTEFLAYGVPSYKQALVIESPEDVTTTLIVDVYGRINSIEQSGKVNNNTDISLTEYRAYDSNHYLCKIARADVGVTVFSNSAIGQVNWQAQGVTSAENTDCLATDTDGKGVTFTYDNLGDNLTVDYANEATPDLAYILDNNGNVTDIAADTVSHHYDYNKLNLLTSESLTGAGFGAKTLEYGYSALGHKSSFTYPDSDRIDFAPNGFGEPTQAVRQQNEGTNRAAFSYASGATYYPSGSVDTFTYGNEFVHKTELHNLSNLPRRISDINGSSKALDYSYTYDNNANVTSLIDGINSDYSLIGSNDDGLKYDGLDRLTATIGASEFGNSTINYDGLGNITSYVSFERNLTYHYDRVKNTLTSVDTPELVDYRTFNYDDRGNVDNNGFKRLWFNRANQLIASGASVDDSDSAYLYDGHNRRVRHTNEDRTKYSFYSQDGTLVYSEEDGAGVNYIYLGKKLIAKDGVVRKDSGKQHYRPYGESIEGANDDIGYTGHKYDTDLGLSYMQARYYDPVIGRFYSNDPVDALGHMQGLQGIQGFNRYAYVNNNPYKFTDPDGKNADQNLGAFIGAWIETGSIEEAGKLMEQRQKANIEMLKQAGSLTTVGLALDTVDVASKIINEEDPIAKLKGMGAGEIAAEVTEVIASKKLGDKAGEATGALVGKVIGDVTEHISKPPEIDGYTGADHKNKLD